MDRFSALNTDRYIIFRDEFTFVGETNNVDDIPSIIEKDKEVLNFLFSLNKKFVKLFIKGKKTLPEPHYSIFKEVNIQ